MNILFILYGDFSTNTANPIALFASHLRRLGHNCIVAIPSGMNTVELLGEISFLPILYEDVILKEGAIFPNGARADVIHACTMRIGIINFLKQYLSQWPAPLVVYLEDNETWIAEQYLGLNHQEVLRLANNEISAMLPSSLSNPFEYPYALALANLVILIQEKLRSEVPSFTPTTVIPWGVDQSIFHPDISPSGEWRCILNIDECDKIIVYHGGLNGFTRPAMLDLCRAVELINLSGISCKLIRTGINPINFWNELGSSAKEVILDIGVVDREDLPSILALAHLYVQPGRISPFEDLRLPSKLPEFLAMGRPVIMPNVNIANLFRDHDDAILLKIGEPSEIADACIALFQNDQYSIKLGLAAREFAREHFEIVSQTKKLELAYIKAANNFNADETKGVWSCLKTHGAIKAALMRVDFLLKGENLKQSDDISHQLLSWCNEINIRLCSINDAMWIPREGAVSEKNSNHLNGLSKLRKAAKKFIKLLFRY